MRSTRALAHVLVAIALTGCSLYFGDDDEPIADPYPDPSPDPDPDPDPTGGLAIARCEDGTLMRVKVREYQPDQPAHGAGQLLGRCTAGCASAAYLCPGGDCTFAARTLCEAEASEGAVCGLEGASCSGAATTECPATTTCGFSVPGSTCACTDSTYHCTPRTPVPAVQQKLVGKWKGMVMPPSFSTPYPVSLWIYPDGTYWAECERAQCTAFYYGGDGPHPDRTISILSSSATEGAWANIGIFFGASPPNTGAISALVANDTRLRFTFNASWLNCGQPFYFDLTRVP